MNYILMNAPMALATQQGIKTQTRRVASPTAELVYRCAFATPSAPYKIGEVIWVREPVRVEHHTLANVGFLMAYRYLSDTTLKTMRVPERFKKLPKWIEKEQGIPNGCIREMARTFIRVTDIRVERLNEISEEDCLREGIRELSKDGVVHKYCVYDHKDYSSTPWTDMVRNPKEAFCALWESINGKNSFDNRYVFVIELELISKEEAIK